MLSGISSEAVACCTATLARSTALSKPGAQRKKSQHFDSIMAPHNKHQHSKRHGHSHSHTPTHAAAPAPAAEAAVLPTPSPPPAPAVPTAEELEAERVAAEEARVQQEEAERLQREKEEDEERTRQELDAQLEAMAFEEEETRKDDERRAVRAKNTPGAVAGSRASHNANKNKLKSDLKKVSNLLISATYYYMLHVLCVNLVSNRMCNLLHVLLCYRLLRSLRKCACSQRRTELPSLRT
jgi:type IV secretory pathway VirB10-like protein